MDVTCSAPAGTSGAAKGLAPGAGGGGRIGAAFECARFTRKKLTICPVMGRRLPWPPIPAMTWNGAVAGMSFDVSGFSVGPVGVGGSACGPEPALPVGVPSAVGSKSE